MLRCKTLVMLLFTSMLASIGSVARAQLSFNITAASGTDPTAFADFQRAANSWSNLFTDNMTVNLTFNFTNLNDNTIIGYTQPSYSVYSYSIVRGALIADATSADDILAVGSLQNRASAYSPYGASFNMITNRTSDNPNGTDSATPYLDSNGGKNNSVLQITTANAKALGIYGKDYSLSGFEPTLDATVTFNSGFAFDYNPDDGINGSQIDFVGVATHEIGHALGFDSGVDILEANTDRTADSNSFVSTLDLYRFSDASVANGNGTIDFTADARDKYFSIDGGVTKIASFSTGSTYGDGQQASHWKDNLNLGIMDPTAAYGERLTISQNDIRAFDVIGYNIAATPEPSAPATFALGALGVLGLIAARRQRRGTNAI